MKLVDITKENWIKVIFLTTNQKVTIQGNRDPYDVSDMPTLCEEFVASNALSIVQSVYENGWRSVKKGSAGTEAGLNLNTNVEMEAKSNLSVLVYANVLV